MKTKDIEALLEDKLCAGLPCESDAPDITRRIVIWHDAGGSFETDFDRYAVFGLGFEPKLKRPLELVKADEVSKFALKRIIYRQKPESDFLIYTKSQRDLSPHGLEGNWLADIEFLAEHFQADYASMLLAELDAGDLALEGLERFKTFFRAADRKRKFLRLMPNAQTKEDVALGVIGSLLGASDLSDASILKSYLVALLGEDEPLSSLAKFGADGAFASYAQGRLGFTGDLTSVDDLAAHILLSALSCTLPEGSLNGLEAHISEPHAQICQNIVDDWIRDDTFGDDLYELCRRVERKCNLEQRFTQMSSIDLVEADILPCINERILVDLLDSMAHGADRAGEAATVAKRRKGLAWYSRVAPYFEALHAAVDAARFFRDHAQGFHYATPVDVWKAYTTDWYRMDTFYRKYYRACDDCLRSTNDIPWGVDDALENLTGWMERIYKNWFLSDSNACWVSVCEQQWKTQGYVEGINRQRHFFEEQVASGAGATKRTLVIVSDALRYEVAVELAERLERDTRGTAELRSMQGVFPTITEYGMAALLPHKSMAYDSKSGEVSCDDRSATKTKEREQVLRARAPKSRAIQSKDLLSVRRSDQKRLVCDAEIIYVYHNCIDAIGENYNNEHRVFSACKDAIDDIALLVKTAINNLNISRVVITADHGFIYTREALAERDKVGKDDIGAETVRLGRRYAIVDGTEVEDGLFIKMNMDDIKGGAYTGLSPRECVRIKKAGPGERYVHGGASLQEMCVPVIQFRDRRSGSRGFVEQQTATVKLLSTSRRVNSMIFRVELFQPEVVGGKIQPGEYELVMEDASGNAVSNVVKAHADMTDSDETARVIRCKFSLKAGRQYSSKEKYYLTCRKRNESIPVLHEEYNIDVAFAAADDFGF